MSLPTTQPDAKRTAKFVRLLQAFQSVERVAHVPDFSRSENDAEHSYALTMLCWYLLDTLHLKLDKKKVLEYALVHDFVEVYAGDSYIFDPEARKSKLEREEKARIRLKEEFPEFEDLHTNIAAYEEHADPEAVFVNEVDKLIPLVINYVQSGYSWKQMRVQPGELFENKRNKITKHPEVREILEQFITELESRLGDFFD